jgi:cytochrome oxidase Cu insertion factor (SCO1/SenC/PrrC family)
MTSGRLAALSLGVALGGVAAYGLLFRVAAVRNHPVIYVAAFAVATALAVLALVRARRWPAWAALGLSVVLLVAGSLFNFVMARVPTTPSVLRVGERAPDFTLPDAAGRPVTLADFRGKKPVVLVFYRGAW